MFDLQGGCGVPNLFNENNQTPNLKQLKIGNQKQVVVVSTVDLLMSSPRVQIPPDASVGGKIPV